MNVGTVGAAHCGVTVGSWNREVYIYINIHSVQCIYNSYTSTTFSKDLHGNRSFRFVECLSNASMNRGRQNGNTTYVSRPH